MKDIEASVFRHFALEEGRLPLFGFDADDDEYRYHATLLDGAFSVEIRITHEGEVDGRVLDGDEEFEGYRHAVLGTFSAQVKEEYVALLQKIRDACFRSVRPVDYYLIPSNPAIYDIDEGFRVHQGFLEWPARKRVHEGDIIFIYSAKPFMGIAFQCVAVAVDEAQEGYGSRAVFSTMLKLVRRYAKEELPLEDLKKHGLKTVRFFHKISPELGEYLLSK